MALEGKLVDQNGVLFVLVVSPRTFEPVIDSSWWKVEATEAAWGGFARPEAGDPVTFAHGNRWYAVDAETGRSAGVVYTAPDAPPTHHSAVSAPTPKVRAGIEVRWHNGRWEKLLKKGWVPA